MQEAVHGSVFNESHIHLYADIARRLGFAPTRQMLDCLPEAAPMMFLRHDPAQWEQARRAVHLLSPDIPAWTSRIAADGTRLASVPEKIVYDTLGEIRTEEVNVVTHPRFRDLFEADFGLAHGPGPATGFLEVFGMLQRAGAPCNAEAESYKRKAERKIATYTANGVLPTLIYLDDVCHPSRLRRLLHEAIAQLREAVEIRNCLGVSLDPQRATGWVDGERCGRGLS